MDITNFLSNFRIGARPNLYRVSITGMDQKFDFTCISAQIPGRTINEIQVPFLNNKIKVAGDEQFDPWTVQILNDIDYLVRNQLENWMSQIKSHGQTQGATRMLDYMRTGYVVQLDQNAEPVPNAMYELQYMWPTTLDQIDLNFESGDEIERYGCTFAYTRWKRMV